ncbi:MAG: hypothetical protein GY755_17200 [Chloroflexi bacterium]|nr:hypothetical protein [Chloroflexota bacterium]
MNAKKIFIVFVLSMMLGITLSLVNMQIAQAQGCTDATGAPIECPSDDTGSGDTGGDTGGDDTGSDDTGGDDTGGDDTGSDDTGSSDSDDQKNTPIPPTATFTPTPTLSSTVPTDPTPTSEPSGSSTGENDAGSPAVICGNDPKHPSRVVNCALKLTNKCLNAEGTSSQTPQEDGHILVTCSKDVLDEPLPEDEKELSATPPSTDEDITCYDMFCVMDIYIGCWWSNGNYSETANPDGSVSVSCDSEGEGFPYPNLGLLAFGILIGLAVVAIPAFIKYWGRRKSNRPKDTEMKNKEAVYLGATDQPKAERTPTREHILLNKEDDGATLGDFDGDGDVDGADFASGAGRDIVVSRDDKDKE